MITIQKYFSYLCCENLKTKIMKKLLGGIFAVAIAIFMFSCNPQTKVTITLTPDKADAGAGTVVKIVYTLTPDAVNNGELGDFEVTDGDGKTIKTATYSGTSSKTDSLEYTVPNDATVGSKITLNFTAKDGKSGLSNTVGFDITIVSLVPELVIKTGKQATYVSTSLNSTQWFKLGTDDVTLVDANSTDIDLAFVWNGTTTYLYSVVSPDAQWIVDLYAANSITYNKTNKKNTKIQKYTGNWDTLDKEAINNLTITSSTVSGGGNGVQNLTVGDVLVFQTADGRKGALKITSNAKVIKHMTVDIKYQQTASAAK